MDTVGRIVTAILNLPGRLLDGLFQWSLAFLTVFLGWFPDHQPIAWPDMSAYGGLFRGLNAVNRFVDLPVLSAVFGTIVAFESALLVYVGYRALLGFLPFTK